VVDYARTISELGTEIGSSDTYVLTIEGGKQEFIGAEMNIGVRISNFFNVSGTFAFEAILNREIELSHASPLNIVNGEVQLPDGSTLLPDPENPDALGSFGEDNPLDLLKRVTIQGFTLGAGGLDAFLGVPDGPRIVMEDVSFTFAFMREKDAIVEELRRYWLALQARVSRLPEPGRLLIETFPHDGREHACIYGFAGRNAQQTLGLLLTKRMEEMGLDPLGFVATDYATLIWGLKPLIDARALLDPAALEDGLEDWFKGNAVMKRTFRASATIAGLIDRMSAGQRKSGRQATFSSDILYDTLVKYDPDHLLLRITRTEAMRGLVDFGRVREMLARVGDRIDLVPLKRLTPFAAPLFLEAGRVPVEGMAREKLMAEAAADLMREAGLG